MTLTLETVAPLSVAQEAVLYTCLLSPSELTYNETISIRRHGPLDAPAFRSAFNEIVARHESWRTTFDTRRGDPVQVVHPPPRFELPILDLSRLPAHRAEHRAVELAAAAARVPYDLSRGPLVRPRLVRFPGDEHRLYLSLHHLIFDGVSVNRVILPELAALYDAFAAGLPSPLPDPPTQYADYSRWDRERTAQPRFARRLEHWVRHLARPPALELPLDHPRSTTTGPRGGMVTLTVPDRAVERLHTLGRDTGSSLFQVLASAWAALLHRYSGQDEVVFAAVADLRHRPEFESVVGYCVTPVPLRVTVTDDLSFAEMIVRVRNELLDALDHLVPFERVVRELGSERLDGANPIYQTMIVLEPATVTADPVWSIHQFETEIGDAVGNVKLDLELQLDERPDGSMTGRLIYDRALFDRTTVTRIADHWLRLLAGVAADPAEPVGSVSIITADESASELAEFNATTTDQPARRAHELFEAHASRHPDAPAVVAGERIAGYGELNARGDEIAGGLRAAGIGAGDLVAVRDETFADAIAAVLGVLKAGAAYLLLDPSSPSAELDAVTADAGAATVLPAGVPSDLPATRLALALAPAVCCVHYASTGTGPPRGVPLRHDAVINLVTAVAAETDLGPADTILALPSGAAGAAPFELWLALVTGARIVVAPPAAARDGAALSRLIRAEGVTFLHAPPETWETLVQTGLKPRRSLTAMSGGDPVGRELADRILSCCRTLWQAYGVPEATVYSTLGRVEPSGPVTIGRPIANTRIYIIDAAGRPVPIGMPGELLIAGDGVAGGYVRGREPGADRFVADPYGPGTAYRTGRQARWLCRGELELRVRRSGRPLL